MNAKQFYILLIFYLYLNIPLSIDVIKRNFSLRKKLIYITFAWLLPIVGYFIITFKLINKGFWNKILNFGIYILIYGILLSIIFYKLT